ncbi:ribosome maturation factor RimP [Bryocella elongata]|uniref:Ribosome maturation factor RimP n=1 Tax=Bryocella elongata TaxID=863522 RepID=A0A1H5WBX9_9BACT|nr:ribosome maturation factor RimP [Bryocella elongata]SEF96307.1 ribosome maturation factor RimP [Bryocella elongata]
MAVVLDKIRDAADRVAASHGLDVVDLEFTGGGKHRALRIFLEKNAEERAKLAALALIPAADSDGQVALPQGVPAEALSGITHEDCALFASDFGTLADVEDLVPGAEYTLEVSSPGLERKLLKPADYSRFTGFLVKLQTFTPVNGNRQFTGRLTSFDGLRLTLDLAAIQQKGKAARKNTQASPTVELDLANVEKAHLVAEI